MYNFFAGLETPHRKIGWGAAAASTSIVALWILQLVTGMTVPDLVEGAVATLAYFLTSYIVPQHAPTPPPEPEQSPPA